MGRPRKFTPRLATAADLDRWRAVEARYGDEQNGRTRERICQEFLSFHRMNVTNIVTSFKLWIGAASSDGLMWSTIDTYSGYISRVVMPDLSSADRIEWRLARKIVRAAHADEDTGGARACTREELQKILIESDLNMRQAIALIAYTGARWADIRRLRLKQIAVKRNSIRIQVRISKNRRKRSLRRNLKIRDVAGKLGLELDPSLFALVESNDDPFSRPFEKWKVDDINKHLKITCLKCGLEKLTSYSFRKFFIRNIIRYYEGDWATIINYTLHTKLDVVAAHYDAWDDEVDE